MLLGNLVFCHGLLVLWRRGLVNVWEDNMVSLAHLDRFCCFRQNCSIIKLCKIWLAAFSDNLVVCSALIGNSTYWQFNSTLADHSFKCALRIKMVHFLTKKEWFHSGTMVGSILNIFVRSYVTYHVPRSIKNLENEIVELGDYSESTENRSCSQSTQ